MSAWDIGELERTQSGMIRIGVVSDLDEANARVKVTCGGLDTDWLPWGTGRAGATRTWSPPHVGEQVLVFAPYGDPSQAVVGPSIYQDAHPAPATSKDQETMVFSDGTTVDYNTASNTLTINIAGAGKANVICKEATVQAATSVTFDTPQTNITGDLSVRGAMNVQGEGATGAVSSFAGSIAITGGDVSADGIGLKSHHHTEHDGPPTGSAQA